MISGFRLGLTLLVLSNIVFVNITGAVGMNWLVPLYSLTLAAPLLTRFVDMVPYRIMWNMGVLAIFTILLLDAQKSGIEHLLEDGLLLAAFCQVHLLNVLQRKQKPDLLFFNSFLIALVTSFFSQDLNYSAVFIVYAVLFIATMQMSTLANKDHVVEPELLRIIWRDVARKSAAVLAVTTLAFMFWPRDFQREGLVSESMAWNPSSSGIEFNDEVRLGRSSHTTLSNHVVMQINLKQGNAQQVPSHWRGATMDTFYNGTWISNTIYQPRYREGRDSDWMSSINRIERYKSTVDSESSALVNIQFYSPKVRRLFAPLSAHRIGLDLPEDPSRSMPFSDGTLGYTAVHRPAESDITLQYSVWLATSRKPSDQVHPPVTNYLNDIHPGGVPESAQRCRTNALVGLRGMPQAQRVEACRTYLANNFSYLLPGEQGAASGLEEFMSGTAGGHCEYFATALAIMLQQEGITCRLVTGYLAEEWDESRRTLTVRARHAHAWIEVWDMDRGGWYTVDPSPSGGASESTESFFAQLSKTAEEWWASVTQFDAKSRAAVFAWIANTPHRIISSFTTRPLQSTGILGLVIATIYALWRLIRKRVDPILAAYQKALRRAGVTRTPTETPRELLGRARQMDLPQPRLDALALATADHERSRFALTDR